MQKKDHEWREMFVEAHCRYQTHRVFFSKRKKKYGQRKGTFFKMRATVSSSGWRTGHFFRKETKFFNCRQSCDVPYKWEYPLEFGCFAWNERFCLKLHCHRAPLFHEASPRRKHYDVPSRFVRLYNRTQNTRYFVYFHRTKENENLQIILLCFA